MPRHYEVDPFTGKEVITITRDEYEGLLQSEAVLQALQVYGVDNWEGYPLALESIEGEWT